LEDEGAGATREVETDELFELSGFMSEPPLPPPPVVPIPPPPPDLVIPPSFEETQPMSRLPSTIRPSMPQEEYVEHMMRQAPPSDAGLIPLGGSSDESFGMLTPWPASVPPERDPASVSNLFEMTREVLSAAPLPAGMEDMTVAGGGFGEMDFAELMPEMLGNKPAPSKDPAPNVEMDELDQLLIDEMRAVRAGQEQPSSSRSSSRPPPSSLSSVPPTDVSSNPVQEHAPGSALDVAFDDPLFLPPSESGLSRALSALDYFQGYTDSHRDPGESYEVDLPQPVRFPEDALDDGSGEIEPIPPTVAPDTVQDTGLVAAAYARQDGPIHVRLERVRARFEVGDFSGALVVAEGMLDEEPKHLAAKCYADSCRAMLRQMYLARIGDKAGVLKVVMDAEQVKGLQLDHREGFLLSCVDGLSTIDEILDVSGMPPLDALRILYELLQEGAIEAEPPLPRRSRGDPHGRRLRAQDLPGGEEPTSRRR
jgi:hypothetical protein